jgi:hypothetical protein
MMASSGLGIIQFINTSRQGDVTSAEDQRRANSHAARIAHAKTRRLRTIEYQASKARQEPKGTQSSEDRRIIATSGMQPIPDDMIVVEQSILPSPMSLLASDRRDPFDSFGRAFKPVEHFLLDYCKSSHRFYWYCYGGISLLWIYLT